jgi:hypothetical protein
LAETEKRDRRCPLAKSKAQRKRDYEQRTVELKRQVTILRDITVPRARKALQDAEQALLRARTNLRDAEFELKLHEVQPIVDRLPDDLADFLRNHSHKASDERNHALARRGLAKRNKSSVFYRPEYYALTDTGRWVLAALTRRDERVNEEGS